MGNLRGGNRRGSSPAQYLTTFNFKAASETGTSQSHCPNTTVAREPDYQLKLSIMGHWEVLKKITVYNAPNSESYFLKTDWKSRDCIWRFMCIHFHYDILGSTRDGCRCNRATYLQPRPPRRGAYVAHLESGVSSVDGGRSNNTVSPRAWFQQECSFCLVLPRTPSMLSSEEACNGKPLAETFQTVQLSQLSSGSGKQAVSEQI